MRKPIPFIALAFAGGLFILLIILAIMAASATLPQGREGTANVGFQRTDYTAATNPQSVAVGDFNGDGKQDMAVANYSNGGAGTVSIFLGNGDGIFQPGVGYATGSGPVVVVAADFNHDGKLDLATADDTGNSVSVLLGNGDGTFQPHVNYPAGSFPHWVAVGDFNNDGIPDLVATNEGSNTVSIFLGNGDGTFQAQTTLAAPTEPYSVAVADFNNDGFADLAVTGYYSSVAAIYLGSASGFQPYVTYPCGMGPAAILATDLNHDGNADLAVADYNNGNTGFASVLLGNGDGTFQAATTWTAGTGPDEIAVGNFNGDRFPDLVVTNLLANTMSVLYGNGNGTFQSPVNFDTGTYPIGVAAGQFNGERKISDDIAVANDLGDTVSVFLNEAATSVGLSSAPNPSTAGEFVLFTATVTPAIAGLPVPTGTVEFTTGPKVVTATLTNGVATADVKIEDAGRFRVVAVYRGDANYNPNRSAPITQVVNP